MKTIPVLFTQATYSQISQHLVDRISKLTATITAESLKLSAGVESFSGGSNQEILTILNINATKLSETTLLLRELERLEIKSRGQEEMTLMLSFNTIITLRALVMDFIKLTHHSLHNHFLDLSDVIDLKAVPSALDPSTVAIAANDCVKELQWWTELLMSMELGLKGELKKIEIITDGKLKTK